jgi:hypothetical protein
MRKKPIKMRYSEQTRGKRRIDLDIVEVPEACVAYAGRRRDHSSKARSPLHPAAPCILSCWRQHLPQPVGTTLRYGHGRLVIKGATAGKSGSEESAGGGGNHAGGGDEWRSAREGGGGGMMEKCGERKF